VRPLPRLLAFVDDRVAALEDLGVRAAAIAAAGPAAALVARLPSGTANELGALAERFSRLARPPMAAVLVTGRADIAMAVGAQGVVLRDGDLAIDDVRQIVPSGSWCFRTVHSEADAEAAIAQGADALVVGTIWATPTHPGREPGGLGLLSRIAARGVPSFAIGGVTATRAHEAREAGAWGVAAIRAVWDSERPFDAALALIDPWLDQ
jgi:thiamine-phosphate pyrophosphorylase